MYCAWGQNLISEISRTINRSFFFFLSKSYLFTQSHAPSHVNVMNYSKPKRTDKLRRVVVVINKLKSFNQNCFTQIILFRNTTMNKTSIFHIGIDICMWWWFSCQVVPDSGDPMDCSQPDSSDHGIFLGKNTGVSSHFLIQGIFPNQGLNPGLHCR